MNRRAFIQSAAASLAGGTAFAAARATAGLDCAPALSRSRHRSSRSSLPVQRRHRRDRAARDGLSLERRARLLSGSALPHLERHPEQPHAPLERGRRNSQRLPPALQLRERQHAGQEGRLVTCEHDTRRVTRTEYDGRVTVILDRFDGKPLNSPNDVIVSARRAQSRSRIRATASRATTNPRRNASSSCQRTCIASIPASGAATVVAGDFVRPNGLALSPDEKLLYVVDSAGGNVSHIRVFEVNGKRLVKGRVFAEMGKGTADGVRTDEHGNVWCTYGLGRSRGGRRAVLCARTAI